MGLQFFLHILTHFHGLFMNWDFEPLSIKTGVLYWTDFDAITGPKLKKLLPSTKWLKFLEVGFHDAKWPNKSLGDF